MTESLPADVVDVSNVAALLPSADDRVHVALQKQGPLVSVSARCTCGCGTAYFDRSRPSGDAGRAMTALPSGQPRACRWQHPVNVCQPKGRSTCPPGGS
ncbi:hypothetical protein ACIRNI_22590 [Streptomyces sp. NPDC093546]|jgi:hypothetical protein|uniref:hypothetical protein n=1 Tax=Streptomyces sp. NPDC093546 TaxID=3366040 RepID=UPI0037FAC053